MGNVFRRIDRLGNQVEFNFGRRPRYQTITGGVLSLLAYSLIIFVAYTFFSKLFLEGNVDTSSADTFTSKYPQINLSENSIYPIFALANLVNGAPSFMPSSEISKYITVQGANSELNFVSLDDNSFNFTLIK